MSVLRVILCYSCLCIISPLWAYSNLIILGDSLSDSGNYPQSTHLMEKRYNDIAQYAFIPPTNPVNTTLNESITIEGRHFPYPMPTETASLLPMTSLDNISRHYRSLNWTHYLTQALFNKTHQVIPERMKAYGLNLNDPKISVNYAWWAAVTSQGCHDDEYHLIQKQCDFSQIFQHSLNDKVENIWIPGLLSQVSLVQNDVKSKDVYTDSNTLYILYAGGNGLYQAQTEWRTGGIRHTVNALRLFHGGGANDIIRAIDKLSKPPTNAQHVLVLNLYDLSYTPRLLGDTQLKLITHLYTRLFNKQLENKLAAYRHFHHKTHIVLFDNNTFFRRWANSSFFSSSLGEQCDKTNPNSPYYKENASPKNCFIDKKHGYLYWNNSHPSTLLHALLASELKMTLNKMT